MRILKITCILIILFAFLSPCLESEEMDYWWQTTFLKGNVFYQESGGNKEIPLILGTVLHEGDVVTTGEASRVSFLLSDGKLLALRQNKRQVLERSPEVKAPTLTEVTKNIGDIVRSSADKNPILKHIAGLREDKKSYSAIPNKTRLAFGDVRFYWTALPKVTEYQFNLIDSDDNTSTQILSTNSVIVKADSLKPNQDYYWEIKDAARSANSLPLITGTFSTLDIQEQKEIEKMKADITQTFGNIEEDDAASATFLIFQLALQRKMYLDAAIYLDAYMEKYGSNAELEEWKTKLCDQMSLLSNDLMEYSTQ